MLHGGTDWMTHSGQTSWCELETTWTNQYRPASQKMVCIRTVGARVQILLCCIYLSHKRFFSRWQDYISFSLWIYHLSIYSQWHFAITLKLLHCRWHHHHRTDWVQQWFSVQFIYYTPVSFNPGTKSQHIISSGCFICVLFFLNTGYNHL